MIRVKFQSKLIYFYENGELRKFLLQARIKYSLKIQRFSYLEVTVFFVFDPITHLLATQKGIQGNFQQMCKEKVPKLGIGAGVVKQVLRDNNN